MGLRFRPVCLRFRPQGLRFRPRVFVLDHRVFVLDKWVFGLRSSFLGLRFRYIPTFTLLSIVSPLKTSSIKIWETIRSQHEKFSLPVAVRVSKTRVLKLPN